MFAPSKPGASRGSSWLTQRRCRVGSAARAGVWPAGGVVLEVVDRPGYILSVWSRHEQGACEDDPRASGERCRKYATRGMCRQQEDPEVGV